MKRSSILILILTLLLALAALTVPGEQPQEEGAELETFVPSEEVPADSAVAFPVDI